MIAQIPWLLYQAHKAPTGSALGLLDFVLTKDELAPATAKPAARVPAPRRSIARELEAHFLGRV